MAFHRPSDKEGGQCGQRRLVDLSQPSALDCASMRTWISDFVARCFLDCMSAAFSACAVKILELEARSMIDANHLRPICPLLGESKGGSRNGGEECPRLKE